MPRPPSKRYRRLAAYFETQPPSPLTRTFAQIEGLLGGPLPLGAYSPAWWAWPSMAVPQVLADIGWQVAAVDVPARTVTFTRVPTEASRADTTA